MAYKAQFSGKLAQHNEAKGSGDRVNAAVVKMYWCRVLNSEQSVTIHNSRFDIHLSLMARPPLCHNF